MTTFKDRIISLLWSLHRARPPAFVSGSPRSGTTWILEVLEQITGARIHWEPINWFLYDRQYDRGSDPEGLMRADFDRIESNPPLREEFLRTLSGRPPRHAHMARIGRLGARENLARLLLARHALVKFVYAQRAVPWLAAKTTNQGCVILRHPISIVASQMHHPHIRDGAQTQHPEWTDSVVKATHPILSSDDLHRWPALGDLLRLDLSIPERLAITACVDLLHPLECAQAKSRYAFIVYENARDNPDAFVQLAHELELRMVSDPGSEMLKRPSRTSSGEVGEANISTGSLRLAECDRETIQRIVEALGLDFFKRDGTVDTDSLSARGFRALIC